MKTVEGCTAKELRRELAELGYVLPPAMGMEAVIKVLFGVLLVLTAEIKSLKQEKASCLAGK